MDKIESVLLVGSFGPPLLAFCRTCKRLSISVHLLEMGKGDRFFRKYSSAISSQRNILKKDFYSDQTIETINSYAQEVSAQAVLAVSEKVLLWLSEKKDKKLLEPILLSSNHDVLQSMVSKERQLETAAKAGFDILPTWNISSTSDVEQITDADFPVCIRPSVPGDVEPPFKAKVIHDQDKLRRFIQDRKRIESPIISQPFKRCSDLKVMVIRSKSGEIIAAKAFEACRKFEGVTLTLRIANVSSCVVDKCVQFTTLAGVVGACHFDLLNDGDKVYFLEINVRLGGVTDKAKRLGFDQPLAMLSAFFPHYKFSETDCGKHAKVVTKKALLNHMKAALVSGIDEIDYPQCSSFKHFCLSFKDLFFAKDSIWDVNDLRGYFWYYLQS